MDVIDLWVETLIFILLLALSAFFSGSEVAIFGLSPREQDEIKESKDRAARKLMRLLETPQQTLITILTGNNAVNIAAASVAALLADDIGKLSKIPQVWILLIEVAVVTGLILILSEITPKIFALRNPKLISLKVASPISFIRLLLFPVVGVFTAITDFFTRALGVEKIRLAYSTEELKTLVEVSEEKGQLEESEKEMITSIFEFGDTLVKEIMVPRTDMHMLSADSNLDEIVNYISEEGNSRYPVFKDDRDDVIGFLYAKDLLFYLQENLGDFNIEKILRPPNFVPENKEISELLKEFQKDKIHMAVVVDEYGGTAGLVTLEDILEEIVGEIQDEYDQESPLFSRIDANTITADARMSIHDFNEVLGQKLISGDQDFETLGGFIYHQMGRIPSEQESIEFGEYIFTVIEIDGQRLKQIRVEKKGV